jgi:NAD(P)H-dependent glutamate synthase small subunit
VGKPTGFMEEKREVSPKRSVTERVADYSEIEKLMEDLRIETQASRCMDCGIPFCHSYGCPVKNRIPDFNDLLYHKRWKKAVDLLHKTNNFPEFTGRVCPALCEEACTLAVNKSQVTIRLLELHMVEKGFQEGWIVPEIAQRKTGKRVAVIGSGPSGLAAAQQLARKGHDVTVIEGAEKAGGLLRYGIPDFKLEKDVIDRRLKQMVEEGVSFETGVTAGRDLSAKYLLRNFQSIILATGSRVPRDLKAPGRDLNGIHFALDYLSAQNQRNSGEQLSFPDINAKDKNVLVIGGGDTGSDCIGTARRQGARNVTQIEILTEPPTDRQNSNPWPTWPTILRTSTSHEEGCNRMWDVETVAFEGEGNSVNKVRCVKVEWKSDGKGGRIPSKIAGSEFIIEADLVLLAMGFIHPSHDQLIKDLGLEINERGNIKVTPDYRTTVPKIFAAGDCARGASLVVWAIAAGRDVAETVHQELLK